MKESKTPFNMFKKEITFNTSEVDITGSLLQALKAPSKTFIFSKYLLKI